MTLRHLKTFIIVAKYESITKAANELNIAQPSVTQTIKELENYYNVTLFDRINKHLIITEEGKALLLKANEVISAFEEFEDSINDKTKKPIIKIGATLTFGRKFIPVFINRIKEKYKNIEFYVLIEKTKVLEDKLCSGELDFALCEGVPQNKYIKKTLIRKDRLLLVCSNDYKVNNHLELDEINNYDILVREQGSATRSLIDASFQEAGIKLKPSLEAISNHSILSSVKHSIGIGILPYPIVKDDLDNNTLKEISIDLQLIRSMYLIKHQDKHLNSYKKLVYNECIALAKEFNKKLVQ